MSLDDVLALLPSLSVEQRRLVVCRALELDDAAVPEAEMKVEESRVSEMPSPLEAKLSLRKIEAVLEKLSSEERREVADWITARLMSEESPEMLAAIDEGLRSLENEPTITAEEVRRNLGTWLSR